jgi:DNA polymerase-3 subunit epsilon
MRRSGYGLANLSDALGISFSHHDALEDARACGEILLHAFRRTGRRAQDWVVYLDQSTRDPLPESAKTALSREVVVFTGALALTRREARELATRAGITVASGVTRKTTLLVVGEQTAGNIGDDGKSAKQRKAETLRTKGQDLRIIGESEFLRLLDSIS